MGWLGQTWTHPKIFLKRMRGWQACNQGEKTSLQLLTIVVRMKSSCDIFGGILWNAWRTSSLLMLANRHKLDGMLCTRKTGGGRKFELVMLFICFTILVILSSTNLWKSSQIVWFSIASFITIRSSQWRSSLRTLHQPRVIFSVRQLLQCFCRDSLMVQFVLRHASL